MLFFIFNAAKSELSMAPYPPSIAELAAVSPPLIQLSRDEQSSWLYSSLSLSLSVFFPFLRFAIFVPSSFAGILTRLVRAIVADEVVGGSTTVSNSGVANRKFFSLDTPDFLKRDRRRRCNDQKLSNYFHGARRSTSRASGHTHGEARRVSLS